jgi:hypothetical protein
MRSVGSIGACDDDFLGADFLERHAIERLAIATNTFPRPVIAGQEASVLPLASCIGYFPPIGPAGFKPSVLLRRMPLHVSNAAISPGLAQAVRGKRSPA